MGEVVKLETKARVKGIAMPAKFSEHEAELLLRWAQRNRFKYEELRYTVETVRVWQDTKSPKPLKRDWDKTVENAMRAGWALRGYIDSRARFATAITPRTGTRVLPREHPITEELIQWHLAKTRRYLQSARYGAER